MKKALIINNFARNIEDKEVFYGTLEDLKKIIEYYYMDFEYEELEIPEGVEEALNAENIEDCFYYIDFYNLNIFGDAVDLELILDQKEIEKYR